MLKDWMTSALKDIKEGHEKARDESRAEHREVRDSIQQVDDKVDDLRERTARLEYAAFTIGAIVIAAAAAVFKAELVQFFSAF